MHQLPNDPDAERALVGSLLIDPERTWEVLPIVEPDDLHDPGLGLVYRAILALVKAGEGVDLVTVGAKSGASTETLAGLYEAVPTALHAGSYARVVAGLALRRRMVAAGTAIATAGYREQDPAAARRVAEQAIADALRQSGDVGKLTDVASHADTVWDLGEEYKAAPIQHGEVRHIDTGWRQLNIALGGWRTGLYIPLGAEHMGKTFLALWAAANVAAKGHTVLFFPLEMTAAQLAERLVLSAADIERYRYERGVLDGEEWERLATRCAEVSEWENFIIDDRTRRWVDIEARVRQVARQRGQLGMVVIDYLGQIQVPKGESRNLELGHLTSALLGLSKEMGCAFVVPHQLRSKLVSARRDKRPRLSDAYESGHIPQDADVVLGLHRDGYWNPRDTERPNVIDVQVLKDRLGGNTGKVAELFFSKAGFIADLARDRTLPAGAPSHLDDDGRPVWEEGEEIPF